MLFCPDCDHQLEEKTFPTDAPGGRITIDHCPFCGGAWFDHFEINRFPTYYAVKLSNLIPEGEFKNLSGKDKCPHCGIKLEMLKMKSLDDKPYIKSCPHCLGHWVSKKHLVEIKKDQDEKLRRAKLLNLPLDSPFAILIPLLILGIISLSIPLTVQRLNEMRQAQTRATELITTPLLIPLERGAVLISFSTQRPVKSTIILAGPERTKIVNLSVNTEFSLVHSLKLTGLSSLTTYVYTITVEDENGQKTTSGQYQFTAP